MEAGILGFAFPSGFGVPEGKEFWSRNTFDWVLAKAKMDAQQMHQKLTLKS